MLQNSAYHHSSCRNRIKAKLSVEQNKSKNGRKEKDNMNKRDEVRIYDPDLDTDKKCHIVFIIGILL